MRPEESPDGGRGSTGSNAVIISNELPPAPNNDLPYVIGTMNFTNSARPRIGNNYTTVTNINHSEQVVKGRLLCLELISPLHANRLRCSVVVFVCWALVIVSLLAVYFFYFIFTTRHRIDIDVSCGQYTWAYVKNSTLAERLTCSLATLLLAGAIALVVYYTVYYNRDPEPIDDMPWYITREDWLATPYNNTDIKPEFEPLRIVVIQHSVSATCFTFDACANEIRTIQNNFLTDPRTNYDIPYNFLVGNDGRVYEGRGWRKEGAHTRGYNRCGLGIGFIGNYREGGIMATDLQQKRTQMLLAEGVSRGYLHPKVVVVGALDVDPSNPPTISPGENLYRAIRKWPQYDHANRFRNRTCEQINAMPFP